MTTVATYTEAQRRNYDPTRTTVLRNTFAADVNRRFKAIMAAIVTGVYTNDCFGLKPPIHTFQVVPPGQAAFAFARSEAKVAEFMNWLQEQVNKELITVADLKQVGTSVEAVWMNKYLFDSYKRGVIRARQEMRNKGMAVPTIDESGGIHAVLGGTPFHLDRIGLIFIRAFTDLKGITDAMDMQISRILAQGMIDGDGPRLLARKLVATIDGTNMGTLGITDTLGRFIPARRRAEMLARTEVIRAHHLATIQEYRNYGVLGITVKAEWRTARDERVCDECRDLEARVFTLDEIETMIPRHPQCRCIALPWIEELQKYR